MNEKIKQFWALREQARYLRDPMRRSGPSVQEAEESARHLDQQADDIAESLFDAGNALHARLEHWIAMNSGICDPKDEQAINNWKNL